MITLLKWVPQALSDCSCSTLNKGFECRPRDTLLVYLCLTVSGGWNHLHQWHEGGWRRVWRILWSFYGPPTSAGGNSSATPRYSLDQHIYKERDEREFWLCFFCRLQPACNHTRPWTPPLIKDKAKESSVECLLVGLFLLLVLKRCSPPGKWIIT